MNPALAPSPPTLTRRFLLCVQPLPNDLHRHAAPLAPAAVHATALFLRSSSDLLTLNSACAAALLASRRPAMPRALRTAPALAVQVRRAAAPRGRGARLGG